MNDQPNAIFSEFALNYVAVNFVCIKNSTTLIWCHFTTTETIARTTPIHKQQDDASCS